MPKPIKILLLLIIALPLLISSSISQVNSYVYANNPQESVQVKQNQIQPQVDVNIYADETHKSVKIKQNQRIGQDFIPRVDNTTDIAVFIKFPGGYDLTMNLFDEENLRYLKPKSVWAGSKAGWVFFNVSSDDYQLRKNSRYTIELVSNYDPMSWAFDDTNPYPDGIAFYSDQDWPEADFGLRTYGYNDEDLNKEDNQVNESANQVSNEQSTNENENNQQTNTSQKVVSSIAPPTKLGAKIEILNNQTSIVLDWQKSKTKNIDGYQIYRSQEKEKGYQLISITSADQTTYIDQDLDHSTTYYYRLSTLKDDQRSKYSNIASATTSTIKTENKASPETDPSSSWRAILLSILSIYLLLLLSFWLSYKRYRKL